MFNRRTYKYFFLLILFAALGGFIPPPTCSNGGIGRHEGLVLNGMQPYGRLITLKNKNVYHEEKKMDR